MTNKPPPLGAERGPLTGKLDAWNERGGAVWWRVTAVENVLHCSPPAGNRFLQYVSHSTLAAAMDDDAEYWPISTAFVRCGPVRLKPVLRRNI